MDMRKRLLSNCAAEFAGTFLLVFTVGCNVLGGDTGWAGVSIGCMLMVAIYTFGFLSGGNFNPAVSISLGITKAFGGYGMDFKDVVIYCAVQIIAGIAAAFTYSSLLFKDPHALDAQPSTGFSLVSAASCEALYTFMLCFVLLNVCCAALPFYGLAMGFVVIAGTYGAGTISGGYFNPAVAISIHAPNMWASGIFSCVVYVLAEIIGSIFAVLFFAIVRPGKFKEGVETPMFSKLVSEFLGTFFLVLTVGFNVLGKSTAGAFSIAASLMSMTYALGDVSGANFNPAVTITLVCSGVMEITHAIPYILVQLAGGCLAGVAYSTIYTDGDVSPLGPVNGKSWGEVATAEIIFTFVLCMVVLGTAVMDQTKSQVMFGLAIGSCVTVGGVAIGGISGGSLNPAVSFGIAAADSFMHMTPAFYYSAFELVGGMAAALLIKITHSGPSMISKCAAEFAGTFLLVFTVGCNVLGNPGSDWGGVSIACVLMVSIYTFGGISGANFNPAVSISLGITKAFGGNGIYFTEVVMYCAVQIIAGLAAALIYSPLFTDPRALDAQPSPGFSMGSAASCEALYTFMLCFVVLNVAAAKNAVSNQWYGLAIGFVIIAGAYGAGKISGGCFNPSVAISIHAANMWASGVAAASGLLSCMVYVVAEIIGAALAVLLFILVRPVDFMEMPERMLHTAKGVRLMSKWDPPKISKWVSEFLGTFFLVLTVGLNVLGKSTAGAFSIAASLTSMIYALCDVSGANFNPAVTITLVCSGVMEVEDAVPYILVQLAAGCLAGVTYAAIHAGGDASPSPLGPVNESTWGQVATAEFIFTFVLCLVVLGTAVMEPTKSRVMFGLTIGSCVTVGGFASGGISGGSLNPAVSFGIAAADRFMHTAPACYYSLFEIAGAVVSAMFIKLTHPSLALARETDSYSLLLE